MTLDNLEHIGVPVRVQFKDGKVFYGSIWNEEGRHTIKDRETRFFTDDEVESITHFDDRDKRAVLAMFDALTAKYAFPPEDYIEILRRTIARLATDMEHEINITAEGYRI
ncbi:MAG: hypothetical protein LUD47_04145 [Clostridia bacterium]|nr:hypothetical protein [Clostridia bacterium]